MNVNLEAMQKRLDHYREAAEKRPIPMDRIIGAEMVCRMMEVTLADFWVEFDKHYPDPEAR